MEDEVRQATEENMADDMSRALARLATSVDVVDPTTLELKIANWKQMRALLRAYISQNMQEGIDYYTLTINGKESKPSLSKAGSEKFMSLFNIQARFRRDEETWEMLGRPAGVVCYICSLTTASGQIVGEGRGARDVKKDGGDVNKAIKMAEKCLGGSTPILLKTPQGISRTRLNMHVDRPVEGKYIAGPHGTWRKILRITKQPVGPVRRLTFRDGLRVIASLGHRWPLANGNLVDTAALHLGDVVMRSTLPSGDGHADLDFAWLAGLYVAEGAMDTTERNVRFSLHAEEEAIAERLARIAERLGAHCYSTVEGNKRTVYMFGPAPMGILKHFVEGRLSYGKHFTHYLFRQNTKVIKAALMGYLVGDGSLTERAGRQPFWTLGFTGQNGQLVEDLRAMCAMLGYRCRLAHGASTETKTRKRFATYTGWIKMTEPKWNESDLGEIVGIENTEEMTYEIEVDGDHLFCLANGLVTHNSAQCDAVLRTGSLSDYFTQDLEDRLEQAERIVRQQKKRIVALLQQLGTGAGDKAAYEAAIQHYTGLALVPASYQEIIQRLEVCVTENLLNREQCADEMSG